MSTSTEKPHPQSTPAATQGHVHDDKMIKEEQEEEEDTHTGATIKEGKGKSLHDVLFTEHEFATEVWGRFKELSSNLVGILL
jgi:hypothetical protein